jgi:uncharacterized protein YndB with AHSA1/START domain
MTDQPIVATVHIDASPEEVFPYLTDADLMMRWMGDWARLEPRPGGEFAVNVTGVPVRGRFVEVRPPHRVVFTWGMAGSDDSPPGSSTVEVTLVPEGGRTVVTLTHRDLPEAQLPQHRVGWEHYLARLGVAGAGGDPGPDPWAGGQSSAGAVPTS